MYGNSLFTCLRSLLLQITHFQLLQFIQSQLFIRVARWTSELLLSLLNEFLLPVQFLLNIGLMLLPKLLLVLGALRPILSHWLYFRFNHFKILHYFRLWFLLLHTLLRLRRWLSKLFFSDLLNLFPSIHSLLQVSLAFIFEIFLLVDISILLWTLRWERIFYSILRILILVGRLHLDRI